MGLFGMKWDRKNELLASDPSQMRMGQDGVIQGGDVKRGAPGYYDGGDEFTGQDLVRMLLASVSDAGLRNRGYDSNASGNLGDMRLSAIRMAREQAQQQALMEAAQRRGLSPDDVTLQQGGIDMPKVPELPERARMAQWYQNASPEERAAYDQTNPIITNGYGSAVVPRSSFPSGLDPNRWERLPDDEGGPTPQASGGFLGSRRFRR